MRTSRALFTLVFTSAVCSFGSVACSGKARSNVAEESSALDAPNGAIDVAANDEPAFADPQIERLAQLEPAVVDATDLTTEAASAPGATTYHLALVWGNMPAHHDDDDDDGKPTLTDWSGSISVANGAIGVKRILGFEEKDAVAARTDPKAVSFTSHTLPYVDGLLVKIVLPANAPAVLHVATAALTTDIDLSSLATTAGGAKRVGDSDEALGWIGFEDVKGCAKGFVHGRWVKKHAGFGHLRGVVSDADGERIGHVRGIWGHAAKRNANVFFGKYIDRDGDSRGLLAGRYGDGGFTGVWGVKDENDAIDVGTLEGVYGTGRDEGDGRGVWLGRWSERCAK